MMSIEGNSTYQYPVMQGLWPSWRVKEEGQGDWSLRNEREGLGKVDSCESKQ